MSLSEQIQRVDGSQNEILKTILKAFGVTIGSEKIDGIASLAKVAANLKENGVLSNDTKTAFGLTTDAVPDDVFQILAQAALYKIFAKTQKIGALPVGTIIYLNENDSPVPYIIVNQGIPQNSSLYDSSCNGTWVLRQDIYENAVWDSGNSNVLPGADIFATMAGMLSLYDSDVQSAIQTVKIPYCVGGGSSSVDSGANGLQCKIFPLGCYELGFDTNDSQYIPIDGARLSYFQYGSSGDLSRIAYFQNEKATWLTRSQYTKSELNIWSINTGGNNNARGPINAAGIRPAFILPAEFQVALSEPIPGLYDVSDNLLLKLPGTQIETGSYVGTGTYGSSNPTTITTQILPIFAIVYGTWGTNTYGTYPVILDTSRKDYGAQTAGGYITGSVSLSGNTISFYQNSAYPAQQGNLSGETYNYIVFGY